MTYFLFCITIFKTVTKCYYLLVSVCLQWLCYITSGTSKAYTKLPTYVLLILMRENYVSARAYESGNAVYNSNANRNYYSLVMLKIVNLSS